MALIHWWPLNGNTKDYGTHPINMTTNYNFPFSSGGKMGQCARSTATDLNIEELSGRRVFSCSVWWKVSSTECTTHYSDIVRFTVQDGSSTGAIRFDNEMYSAATNRAMYFHDNSTGNFTTGCTFNAIISSPYDTWHNYIMTSDGKTMYFYCDGEEIGTAPLKDGSYLTGSFRPSNITGVYVNDIRIYDHALSIKEIKELSKALIVHYNFEDEELEGTENLGNTSATYSNQSHGTAINCSNWGGDAGTCTFYHYGGYNNYPYKVYHKTATGTGGIYRKTGDDIKITSGKTYTMSIYVKASRKITNASAYSFNINRTATGTNGSSGNRYITYGQSFTITTEWQRLVKTFTATDDDDGYYSEMSIIYDDTAADYFVYFSGFQIEEKSYATAWTKDIRLPGEIVNNAGYEFTAIQSGNITLKNLTNKEGIGLHSINIPSGSYIKTSSEILSGPFTLSVWAKTSSSSNQCLFCDRNGTGLGPALFLLSGNSIRFDTNNTSFSSTFTYGDGKWHLYTAVFDGSVRKMYVDGVLKNTSGSSTLGGLGGAFTIGASYAGNNGNTTPSVNYFIGEIADYKIYATALSADNVLNEYQSRANLDRAYVLSTYIFKENTKEEGFLPASYIPVEYIQSSGTQYIDTEFVPTADDITLEIDATWTGSNLGAFETFIGFMKSTTENNPRIGLHKYSSKFMFGANTTKTSSTTPPTNTRFTLKGIFKSGDQKLYLDNTLIADSTSSFNFSSNLYPIYIFARYCPNSNNFANMRLYRAKIWERNKEDNILTRDFIPCRDSTTNINGLYDLVTKKFYTNQGSGNFSAGSVITNTTDIYGNLRDSGILAVLEKNGIFYCDELDETKYPTFKTYDNGSLYSSSFTEGSTSCSHGDRLEAFKNFKPLLSVSNNQITILNYDELDPIFKNEGLSFGFDLRRCDGRCNRIAAMHKEVYNSEDEDSLSIARFPCFCNVVTTIPINVVYPEYESISGLDDSIIKNDHPGERLPTQKNWYYFNQNYFNSEVGTISSGFLNEWDQARFTSHETNCYIQEGDEYPNHNGIFHRYMRFFLVYNPGTQHRGSLSSFRSDYADKQIEFVFYYGDSRNKEKNIQDYNAANFVMNKRTRNILN